MRICCYLLVKYENRERDIENRFYYLKLDNILLIQYGSVECICCRSKRKGRGELGDQQNRK